MAKNNYFRFKQFLINQERAAMKVGTDGVLLGAWANVTGVSKVLDIGAGTGLIALMMAQRTKAKITGIEIEKNAAEEATGNVSGSPWKNRVKIQNISFQDFVNSCSEFFDLVISNPPFFTKSRKPESAHLAAAKHDDLLPLPFLVQNVGKLLSENGRFAVIIPAGAVNDFLKNAENAGLFLIRETAVRPNNLKKVHRYLMEFSKKESEPKKDNLNIHTDDGTDFTESYKMMTRDFYLNF